MNKALKEKKNEKRHEKEMLYAIDTLLKEPYNVVVTKKQK